MKFKISGRRKYIQNQQWMHQRLTILAGSKLKKNTERDFALNLPKLTIRTKNAFCLQIRKSVYKCEQIRSFLKKLLMINFLFCAYYPANIYLFKFSNRNVEMVWNMLQVSNKDTRTTSVTLFWCLYCEPWTYFTSFSSVSIFDFETCNC